MTVNRSKIKLSIVKIGGAIINDQVLLDSFLLKFSEINGPKILIHGGGRMATKLNDKLGYETKMNQGRRITSSDNLDVVTMVYAGLINKKIVVNLQGNNCNAIGLSGADGNSVLATKRPIEPIDFGHVGDIEEVNVSLLNMFLENDLVPVFSAISHDGKGQLLNTNADTIAAEIAIAMNEDFEASLFYCFEKSGVLIDVDDEASLIEQIDENNYQELLEKKIINDGMLPKMENAFYTLNNGVAKVVIGGIEFMCGGKCTMIVK